MIKVFGMQRGGTNILCNMIYSFPAVVRPEYSELLNYIYKHNSIISKIRIRYEKMFSINYLHPDNYDADDRGGVKLKKVLKKLRSKNYLVKVVNGNITYYDAINDAGDKNIILLRDKISVFGSMVRRGAKPVATINDINNFYKFAEYFAKRDNLLVIKFEDMVDNYAHVLGQVSDYLGYKKIDKVYFGLKPTLTNTRVGRERLYIDVSEVQNYLDDDINEKQMNQLESSCGKEMLGLYKMLLAC